MNKQEQKNKLWALKWIDKEIEENERHAHQKTGTEANTAYWKGYIASCKNIRYIVKELDEPQKPKTEVFNHDEKFVVEWLDHTTGYHYSLYNAINDAGSEVRSWMKIGFNSNKFARAFMSMDYEVEKEPLYYVRLPYEFWDEEAAELKTEYVYLHHEITSDETRIFPIKEPRKGFSTKLDEITIKSVDERYWPFAVPVEEGLEQEEEG